jgi:hypothetical protein
MTYHQEEEDFYNPPTRPIPDGPKRFGRIHDKFCSSCQRHIQIQTERITDDYHTGKPRFRRIPRNVDDNEIHECSSKRIKFNDTKKESEIS